MYRHDTNRSWQGEGDSGQQTGHPGDAVVIVIAASRAHLVPSIPSMSFKILSLSDQANKQNYEFVFADNVRENIVPSIVGLYNFRKYVFTFRR